MRHVRSACERCHPRPFQCEKVTSSHAKGECVILSEEALDETALRAAIAGTGYELKSLNSEEYKKKGFLGLFGG